METMAHSGIFVTSATFAICLSTVLTIDASVPLVDLVDTVDTVDTVDAKSIEKKNKLKGEGGWGGEVVVCS